MWLYNIIDVIKDNLVVVITSILSFPIMKLCIFDFEFAKPYLQEIPNYVFFPVTTHFLKRGAFLLNLWSQNGYSTLFCL